MTTYLLNGQKFIKVGITLAHSVQVTLQILTVKTHTQLTTYIGLYSVFVRRKPSLG